MGDKMKTIVSKLLWALKHACRAVVTVLIGILTTILMAAYVLPVAGALLITNAGITADMAFTTVIVMVIVPEFCVVGVGIAFIIWVTRGVWKLLAPRATQREEDAQ